MDRRWYLLKVAMRYMEEPSRLAARTLEKIMPSRALCGQAGP